MTTRALQREPKGKSSGGQFAPNVNPESTIDLSPATVWKSGDEVILPGGRVDHIDIVYQPEGPDDVPSYRLLHFNAEVYEASQLRRSSVDDVELDLAEPVRSKADAVAWCEGELAKTTKGYEVMVSAGKSDDPDALDMRDYMDELRDQLIDHQGDLIAELRADVPDRLLGLARSAYAVDEAIDTLTRWDGGSGSNPMDALTNLVDVREGIFLASSPELVDQWRDKEAKIREFEHDQVDGDEYEVMRDEREALFQQIYEEALAS